MIPKIKWCNWVFHNTDNMDTDKWMVKRDCCDDEILLIRGDSRNWKAYQSSLKPYRVGSYPDAASMCPNCGKNSWLAKKYGKLDKDTWQETLSKGLSECLRVVKPGCVVAMKWSERDIKTTELLKILPQKPVLGDKTGMTRWLFFVRGVEEICS